MILVWDGSGKSCYLKARRQTCNLSKCGGHVKEYIYHLYMSTTKTILVRVLSRIHCMSYRGLFVKIYLYSGALAAPGAVRTELSPVLIANT